MRMRAMLFALLLVVVGAVPASANHGQSGNEVPIHGAIGGMDERDFDAPDCPGTGWLWRWHTDGTGTVSHLGRVDFQLTHCTAPPSLNHGELVLTAANGDVLEMAYQGVITEVSETYATWEFEWSVAGGTGRFDGATGSGVGHALSLIDLNPERGTTISLEGEIAYDASSRSNR